MQLAPLRLKKGSVRHLVGERVGEGVLEFGKEIRLVEEPGGLEGSETSPNIGVGRFGDLLQQHDGDVSPDDRRGLEQTLLVARQPVDTCRQERVQTRRDPDRGDRLCDLIGSRRSCEGLRLRQGPDDLLEK